MYRYNYAYTILLLLLKYYIYKMFIVSSIYEGKFLYSAELFGNIYIFNVRLFPSINNILININHFLMEL